MRNDQGKSIGKVALTVVFVLVLLSVLSGGDANPLAFLFGFLKFFFWTGFILCLVVVAITAAVIWFTVKDNKFRGKHDPPNVTPKAAREARQAAKGSASEQGSAQDSSSQDAGRQETAADPEAAARRKTGAAPANYRTADRSKVYEKTPEGILQMLSDYRIDYILGPVAEDALKQKERLSGQQESYRRLVERRFGRGTLSAEKYLSVEKSSNDALHNSFLRIANRMEAFDTKEYMHFKSGAYRFDSIPDHVQEQRQEIYEENLRYMKECLADNEHILAGMDRLMLKLADAEASDESSITEEIEQLERQLEYYRKQI